MEHAATRRGAATVLGDLARELPVRIDGVARRNLALTIKRDRTWVCEPVIVATAFFLEMTIQVHTPTGMLSYGENGDNLSSQVLRVMHNGVDHYQAVLQTQAPTRRITGK